MEVLINKKDIITGKIAFSEISNMFSDLGFDDISSDWNIKEAGKRISEKIELKLENRTKKQWSVNYTVNEEEKFFLFTAKLQN